MASAIQLRIALKAIKNLNALLSTLEADHVVVPIVTEARKALAHNFDVGDRPGPGRPARSDKQVSRKVRTLQQQALRLRSRLKATKAILNRHHANRVSGRIQNMWFIRAGLSDPHTPARTVAAHLQEFPEDETHQISHTYVSTVRDTFAHLIKGFNRQNARSAISETIVENESVVLVHVHDEASMRVRSILADDINPLVAMSETSRLSRTRSTKVQNNFMSLACTGNRHMDWFCDLQALSVKDAPSVAKALVQATMPAIQEAHFAAQACNKPCRFTHVVTGDGVFTNLAACRRLWKHIHEHAPKDVQYSLVVFTCASHMANLVVQIAICKKHKPNADNPKKNGDTLCIAASRYFKHLVPFYGEEFRANLLRQVVQKLQFSSQPAATTVEREFFHGVFSTARTSSQRPSPTS